MSESQVKGVVFSWSCFFPMNISSLPDASVNKRQQQPFVQWRWRPGPRKCVNTCKHALQRSKTLTPKYSSLQFPLCSRRAMSSKAEAPVASITERNNVLGTENYKPCVKVHYLFILTLRWKFFPTQRPLSCSYRRQLRSAAHPMKDRNKLRQAVL